jgi:hypothetical protein
MMRLVVVSLLGLFAAACDPSPEQQARDVCTAFCDCQSALPATVDACIADCVDDIGSVTLPAECVDCVYTHSQTCGDLFTECIQSDLCDPEQPQP